MKVLGIGNAIVDVLCKVDDQFILDHSLSKGTMKLVDEKEFKKLLTNLKIEDTISGGSVANSIVGMSQLGDEVSFIGKVNNDELGQKYIKGLRKENVKYFYQTKKEKVPTGTGLILITPDSERTMCTFLGIAGQIDNNDIDANAIQNAEITFLEGYLWDEGGPTKAFEKALSAAKKSAMSLSDPFCVDRHKDSFLNLVKNKLDIIFANEKEAMSLIDAKNFDEVIDFGKSLKNVSKENIQEYIPKYANKKSYGKLSFISETFQRCYLRDKTTDTFFTKLFTKIVRKFGYEIIDQANLDVLTSDKNAIGHYFDGKATLVVGTHTHVPTNDARILNNGTAYQTDAGMCGDYDSVIGGEKNKWIENFVKKPGFQKIKPASINHTICGVIIKVFEDTGLSSVAKQLILGDILENKIPDEKLFLK